MRSDWGLCLLVSATLACGCSSSDSRNTPFAAGGAVSGGNETVAAGGSGAGGVPGSSSGGAATVAVSSGGMAGAASMSTGGSSAGGTPVPVMTASPPPYPYDPGVKFDWPETTPMGGSCRPGTYSGTFECAVDYGLLGKMPWSGVVTFTLAASSSGEFLEIKNGTLQVNAIGGPPLMADLSGKLDCSTNEFHASTMNGAFFSGILEGHLDRLTETLTGTWTLSADLGAGGAEGTPLVSCMGTWSVVRQ
jgi:hypothetical protein